MGNRDEGTWYWCQKHDRPEEGPQACRTMDRLGPYPTEEAARRWRETAEQRNEAWEAADEAWEEGDQGAG